MNNVNENSAFYSYLVYCTLFSIINIFVKEHDNKKLKTISEYCRGHNHRLNSDKIDDFAIFQ